MSVEVTEGIDAGAVWHYGDPFREQKLLASGRAGVDLSHRPVFTISGPDRLRWLNDISSQDFANLAPGQATVAYILSPQGHLNHVFGATDDGTTLWCHTEPGRLPELLAWLGKMIFAARVELATPDGYTLAMAPGAAPAVIPADQLDTTLGESRAGTWAMDALRIEAGIPRIFVDTDDRTIPNELANPDGDLLGPAVHLRKGCYPGQETVAGSTTSDARRGGSPGCCWTARTTPCPRSARTSWQTARWSAEWADHSVTTNSARSGSPCSSAS